MGSTSFAPSFAELCFLSLSQQLSLDPERDTLTGVLRRAPASPLCQSGGECHPIEEPVLCVFLGHRSPHFVTAPNVSVDMGLALMSSLGEASDSW